MEKSKRKVTKNKEGIEKAKEILSMSMKSILIFTSIILLSALFCYFTDISFEKYSLIFVAASVISAFISGFAYSRKMKKSGIIHGILSSLPIALSTLLISLIVSNAHMSVLLPIAMFSVILSGAISGSFGVNSRR